MASTDATADESLFNFHNIVAKHQSRYVSIVFRFLSLLFMSFIICTFIWYLCRDRTGIRDCLFVTVHSDVAYKTYFLTIVTIYISVLTGVSLTGAAGPSVLVSTD